jgi:hypothetical protein
MRTPGLDAVARIRPIVVVDHKILSRDTFTNPDLVLGMYTLNIRITRLP